MKDRFRVKGILKENNLYNKHMKTHKATQEKASENTSCCRKIMLRPF